MPILKTVIVHQIRSVTTITVVMIMICIAFSLDSWIPWMFFHQKYTATSSAKAAEKWLSLKLRGWCRYCPMSFVKPARYWPADTALMGLVNLFLNDTAATEN